jgi:hypothetical protein
MQFRTTLLLAGKTATGIQVPDEVVAGLGDSKRPAVHVTINGYTYRSTVATMGGVFMLPVSAEIRKNANVAAGDEVEVRLELDTEPRVVTVPPDFAEALARDAEAKHTFDKLAYSHQLRHVLAIDEAKTPETRQRRIDKAIAMLREGKS